MVTLAIKGHATRGREVIGLLEMLGAKNEVEYDGNSVYLAYFINKGEIDINDESENAFTLEQFLEKYPYKVGDKVMAWINGYCGNHIIQEMRLDEIDNEIKYRIDGYWYSTQNLKPYTEEKKEETKERKIESFEVLESHCGNEVKIEFDPSKFEIMQRENGWYVVKKQPKHPKTYEECCEVIKIEYPYFKVEEDGISASTYKNKLIGAFKKLLICRDAYWKMAGDWKPDWGNGHATKYVVTCDRNEIKCQKAYEYQRILAFPTEEMRDAFYENFKELIEQCKELL